MALLAGENQEAMQAPCVSMAGLLAGENQERSHAAPHAPAAVLPVRQSQGNCTVHSAPAAAVRASSGEPGTKLCPVWQWWPCQAGKTLKEVLPSISNQLIQKHRLKWKQLKKQPNTCTVWLTMQIQSWCSKQLGTLTICNIVTTVDFPRVITVSSYSCFILLK